MQRKTNNLALRKILSLYFSEHDLQEFIQSLSKNKKKIWNGLNENIKEQIGKDIELFKKANMGKIKLNNQELTRLSEIFNLKNIIKKMLNGFDPVKKDSIQVEMTTVMSSKGLSADSVYYVGIDDVVDINSGITSNHKLREFLVGITRAKSKLTLISLKDNNPKVLQFFDKKYISLIN